MTSGEFVIRAVAVNRRRPHARADRGLRAIGGVGVVIVIVGLLPLVTGGVEARPFARLFRSDLSGCPTLVPPDRSLV
ncbi:MAG: hypothetical protein ACP5H2_08060 [Solirubrobacteraceae bacterium]